MNAQCNDDCSGNNACWNAVAQKVGNLGTAIIEIKFDSRGHSEYTYSQVCLTNIVFNRTCSHIREARDWQTHAAVAIM